MDINVSNFMELFLRLCPFILVCFFTISSIFDNDLKGLVYLIGLLFTVGMTIILGNTTNTSLFGISTAKIDDANQICDVISFGSSDISQLPIGQAIIGFTFTYMLFSMILIESITVSANWPTVVFFIILIITEMNMNTKIFNKNKENKEICYGIGTSVITYIIGFTIGGIWAWLVSLSGSPDLQYFKQYKNNEKCGKVKHDMFKCTVFKNGQAIPSITGGDDEILRALTDARTASTCAKNPTSPSCPPLPPYVVFPTNSSANVSVTLGQGADTITYSTNYGSDWSDIVINDNTNTGTFQLSSSKTYNIGEVHVRNYKTVNTKQLTSVIVKNDVKIQPNI